MKTILIIALLSILANFKREENVKIKIFNDSNFKIEKLKIYFENDSIQFENIEPRKYSEVRTGSGFYKDNCFDITVFKKRLFTRNFWAHKICFPIDEIGNKKIKSGKYIFKIKIKEIVKDNIETETEYLLEK